MQVVMVLKKEIVKTQNKDFEKGGDYRQMLVQAIHSCAVKFPDVASNVVHLLMDFLGDTNIASALDVIFFVREILETNAKLRQGILERLRDTFYQVTWGAMHTAWPQGV
jgi:coatomer subunit beta